MIMVHYSTKNNPFYNSLFINHFIMVITLNHKITMVGDNQSTNDTKQL